VRQQADSLHASMSSAAGGLSLLVRQYGDCTALTMGALTEAETRALVRKVFFGEGSWEDVEADASGCIMSLATEAEHHLFRTLNENQAFKELFSCVAAEPLITVHTVSGYLRRTLSESDPAAAFVDAFAEVATHMLYDLFDGTLHVELSVPDESTIVVAIEQHVDASGDVSSACLRLPRMHAGVVADVPQLPLEQLLTEYCDFGESRAPSLSERDREYLRLLFLWGKDMRSISRAANVTYQRVQQVVVQATRRLQGDLLEQDSYQSFWARLHRFCIVTPGVLSSAVTAVLGGQRQSVDVTAASRFLLYALKSDQALGQYRIGRVRVQCCRGTERQLDSITAYLREVRNRRRGPVSDSDVSAASMYILSHSELPGTSVQAVAALLLTAISPPVVADQLEALLAKLGVPCHFTDLARHLDEECGGDGVSAAYVHAALSRDHRFAWAGLGTYALREWGYPAAGNTLDVVVHMMRAKGGGVTLNEIREFLFVEHKYCVKESSVRAALKLAEGKELVRIGNGVWNELLHGQRGNEETEHE